MSHLLTLEICKPRFLNINNFKTYTSNIFEDNVNKLVLNFVFSFIWIFLVLIKQFYWLQNFKNLLIKKKTDTTANLLLFNH